MRISDWSSDVCSSELLPVAESARHRDRLRPRLAGFRPVPARLHRGRIAGGAEARPGQRRGNDGIDQRIGLYRLARHRRATLQLARDGRLRPRSEEHTSELQSLMRISYAVFCLKKKKNNQRNNMLQIETKKR